MGTYPRYITPSLEPFDPIELARETEEIVCKGDARKYTDFYATGVYGGIATGYTCGCCLRCVFCWVDWSRDFPEHYGQFYGSRRLTTEFTNRLAPNVMINTDKTRSVSLMRTSSMLIAVQWIDL